MQELLEDGLLDHFHKRLVELNMDSAEELQSYINKLQLAVEQGRQKLLHSDGAEGKIEVSVTPPNKRETESENLDHLLTCKYHLGLLRLFAWQNSWMYKKRSFL